MSLETKPTCTAIVVPLNERTRHCGKPANHRNANGQPRCRRHTKGGHRPLEVSE